MQEIGSTTNCVIRAAVTSMYATPSVLSEQVSQALLGDSADALEARGGWRRIRSSDGYEGWVVGTAVGEVPADWSGERWEVRPLWANLRHLPDSRTAARVTAFAGTRLPIVETRDGWVGLRLPGGAVGWTEGHRVRQWPGDAGERPAPGAVIEMARRFLGVPYLWGGCSPLGIDCSGFVQLVWRLHGSGLPRDAHQQAECGQAVSTAEANAGDLLFFGGESGRITHVAICLEGGRMIHAAGGDRVRVNARKDEPYGSRLRVVRRVTR